jgi:hypothetical protein
MLRLASRIARRSETVLTTYSWNRGIQVLSWATIQWVELQALSAGQTLRRIRFRWGFYGDTSLMTDLNGVSSNLYTFGICTTIGDGTEVPPNPRTQSNDQAPPTQRWVYWETRAPYATAVDQAGGVVTWRDTGSTEETSTRGQVLATGLGPGQTLNVWAVMAPAFNWDPSGSGSIWFAYSLLISQ